MDEQKLFHDRYFLERLLGRGNFSEVWLAKDIKTDIQVALKIYAPATGLDDAGLNIFAREFSLVVNANHKNLLKPLYYDSYERKPYLVLPFCKQGSVMKLIGKFTEADAWRFLRDIASGLAFLHSMNPPVIHQDIKPDNVMIGESGDFMITDFGVSTHVKSTLRKSMSSAFTSAGTIAYMAPERFGKDNTPIMANDIYSLGATVYEMLTGDAPFGNDGGLVQKKGAEIPDIIGDYSDKLKSVVSKCLQKDPWLRPTAEQLEVYANSGMKGENIKFLDEKTFFEKYKLYVILGACVVLVGSIIGGTLFNNHRNAVLEREKWVIDSLTQARYDDSIRVCINGYLSYADSLTLIGDEHYENYEIAYMSAYEFYQKALECNTDLPVHDKLSKVRDELIAARQSFWEKADFFSKDTPELASEFMERADKISSLLAQDEHVKIQDNN